MQEIWQCRVAPSLGGGFAGTPNETWGTLDYTSNVEPVVFFGLYGFPDFYELWKHKGKKAILWAGSDIRHFLNDYWLDYTGKIRLQHGGMAKWIQEYCDSYVENEVEATALREAGIYAKVVPSFLGSIHDFSISYRPSNKFYTSVSGNHFQLYGWHLVDDIARQNRDLEFHLYGNTAQWFTTEGNVYVHGRVENMDVEVKEMQGALRLTMFDGFSEILAKSVLWGQWPVSPFINYSFISKDLSDAKWRKEPNIWARESLLSVLNNFPWNVKKHQTA